MSEANDQATEMRQWMEDHSALIDALRDPRYEATPAMRIVAASTIRELKLRLKVANRALEMKKA